jgi:hypothetical protein
VRVRPELAHQVAPSPAMRVMTLIRVGQGD